MSQVLSSTADLLPKDLRVELCDQDVKVVPGTIFTIKACNRCGSLQKRGDVVATSPLALH